MKNYYTNLACGSSKEVALRKAKWDYLENKENQAVLSSWTNWRCQTVGIGF